MVARDLGLAQLAAAAPGQRLDGGRQEEHRDEEHRNLHCAENVSAHGQGAGGARGPTSALQPSSFVSVYGAYTQWKRGQSGRAGQQNDAEGGRARRQG